MADNTKDPFNNVAPEFKPRSVEMPRPNLAPMGGMGIRQNLTPSPVRPTKVLGSDIAKGDSEKHLFVEGKITGIGNYYFIAKVEDRASERGIEGGKISKMDIRQGGVSVARYDRGWLVEPQTSRDAEAVRKVQDKFGGKEREFKPIVPKSLDKDRGHER